MNARALRQVQWNHRRALALNRHSTLTLAEWQRLLYYSRGRCAYCGNLVGRDHLAIDHVVPLTAGGHNTASNVATACQPCNSAKGDKPLNEFHMGLPGTNATQRPPFEHPDWTPIDDARRLLRMTDRQLQRACEALSIRRRVVSAMTEGSNSRRLCVPTSALRLLVRHSWKTPS